MLARRPGSRTHWPSPLSLWGSVGAMFLAGFLLSGALVARAPRLVLLPPLVGGAMAWWQHRRRQPGAGLPEGLAARVRLVALREHQVFHKLRRLQGGAEQVELLRQLAEQHHALAVQAAEVEAMLQAQPPVELAQAEAELIEGRGGMPGEAALLAQREQTLKARWEARGELEALKARTHTRLGLLEDTMAVLVVGVATATELSPKLLGALDGAKRALAEAALEREGQRELRGLLDGPAWPSPPQAKALAARPAPAEEA